MSRMQNSDLGVIAVAAFGIWFFVRFLVEAVGYMTSFREFATGEIPIAFLLPTAVYGVAGTLLLIFRRRFAMELFGSAGSAQQNVASIDSESREFLVSLMGLWFIASGLVDAVATEQKTLLLPSLDYGEKLYEVGPPRTLVTPKAWLARAPYLWQLAIGTALFASGGRLHELWTRLRRAGHAR